MGHKNTEKEPLSRLKFVNDRDEHNSRRPCRLQKCTRHREPVGWQIQPPRECECAKVWVFIGYLECPAWAGSRETVRLGFQLLCGTTVGSGPKWTYSPYRRRSGKTWGEIKLGLTWVVLELHFKFIPSLQYILFLQFFNWPLGGRLFTNSCGCRFQPANTPFSSWFTVNMMVSVQQWELQVIFTHLTVLFSMPVYLWTLIRPERVPRKAVSTPSAMLPQKDWKQIKPSGGNRIAYIHVLCADAHLDELSMRAVQ